jgi:hypothetical protein
VATSESSKDGCLVICKNVKSRRRYPNMSLARFTSAFSRHSTPELALPLEFCLSSYHQPFHYHTESISDSPTIAHSRTMTGFQALYNPMMPSDHVESSGTIALLSPLDTNSSLASSPKHFQYACHFLYSYRCLSSKPPKERNASRRLRHACMWAVDTHPSLSAWSQWVVSMSGSYAPIAFMHWDRQLEEDRLGS